MKKIISALLLSFLIISNSYSYNNYISDREYNLINRFVKNLEKSDAEKISQKIEKIEANYESGTKERILLDRINEVINIKLRKKSQSAFDLSPFSGFSAYTKCNISGKILDIHREEGYRTMLTHLKIETEKGNYNVKVIEGYYFGLDGYGILGVDIFTPKLLEGGGVEYLKKNQDVSFIVDEDTDRLLREGNENYLDNCDVSSQKLGDFEFEGGLTNKELMELNMKKYKEMGLQK